MRAFVRNQRRVLLAVEGVLACLIVVSIGWTAYKLLDTGYLPQPFFDDPTDTFGDWFNPAYYANHGGAYASDGYASVYPPLSYVFLRLFSVKSCYGGGIAWARNCDVLGRITLLTFFALNIGLVFRCYWRDQRWRAIPRTIAVTLGLPMLYALERGNLIIVCFTCFAVGFGPVLRSAAGRWLSLALAINFKPYLLLSAVPLACRRRWRALEGIGVATLLLYLVTLAIEGSGTPLQLLANTINFSDVTAGEYWNDIYYGTTFVSMAEFLNSNWPILTFTGSATAEFWGRALPLVVHGGQLVVAFTLVAAWWRPEIASNRRLATLAVATVLTSTEPSGYAEVFLLFLVFFEPWRGPACIVALVSAYFLAIAADYVMVPFVFHNTTAWLSNRPVAAAYGLSIGQLVRPALILTIQLSLAGSTLAAFVRVIAFAQRARRSQVGGEPMTAGV